jgi:ABC-2 type transport system permease protein
MRIVLAIARRELGAYFDSPLAYFVVPIYTLLVGGFALWFDDIFAAGLVSMRSVFFWCGAFMVLLAPAVTMRLFAEEKRTGSLEIVVTLPIRDEALVLGKYLAALVLVSVAVLGTLTYPITFAVLGITGTGPPAAVAMFSQTGLDWGATVCGYAGLLLMGAAVCAIGTAASSLTSSQIIAFLVALLVSLFPYVTGFFLERFPPELLPWAQGIAFDYHFDNLARGVVDSRDLVFFGSVVAFSLHVAVYSLERRRLT